MYVFIKLSETEKMVLEIESDSDDGSGLLQNDYLRTKCKL